MELERTEYKVDGMTFAVTWNQERQSIGVTLVKDENKQSNLDQQIAAMQQTLATWREDRPKPVPLTVGHIYQRPGTSTYFFCMRPSQHVEGNVSLVNLLTGATVVYARWTQEEAADLRDIGTFADVRQKPLVLNGLYMVQDWQQVAGPAGRAEVIWRRTYVGGRAYLGGGHLNRLGWQEIQNIPNGYIGDPLPEKPYFTDEEFGTDHLVMLPITEYGDDYPAPTTPPPLTINSNGLI